MDVMLDLLHFFTVAFLIEQRRKLCRQPAGRHIFLCALFDDVLHLIKGLKSCAVNRFQGVGLCCRYRGVRCCPRAFPPCPEVRCRCRAGCLSTFCLHVCFRYPTVTDQDDLLSVVIKCDHLIKQHQIDVPELFLILCVQSKRRLRIFDIVVCKISNQTAGQRRELFDLRRAVFFDHPCNHLRRILCFKLLDMVCCNCHLMVHAGQLHRRIEPKKAVPSPLLVVLRTF